MYYNRDPVLQKEAEIAHESMDIVDVDQPIDMIKLMIHRHKLRMMSSNLKKEKMQVFSFI